MIQVSSGIYHTCAIKADRGVLCWGNSDGGQLGHGSTTNNTLAPVTVVGIGGIGELSNITQISSGGIHTCALKTDKSVSAGEVKMVVGGSFGLRQLLSIP